MKYELKVVTTPVAKPRPRVAVRGGKVHGYTPTEGRHAEWEIRQAFLEQYRGTEPLTGPISLKVVACLPLPKSVPKKRQTTIKATKRPDLDNYIKTVLDGLNEVAWVDDSQVVSLWAVKTYAMGLLAGPPRWEITWVELPG